MTSFSQDPRLLLSKALFNYWAVNFQCKILGLFITFLALWFLKLAVVFNCLNHTMPLPSLNKLSWLTVSPWVHLSKQGLNMLCCTFENGPTYSTIRQRHHDMSKAPRFVKGTIDIGLYFTSNTTLNLCAFSDVDWAACSTTRRSTTGYCIFFCQNLNS